MNQRRILGVFIVLIGSLFLLNSFDIGLNAWSIVGTYWPVVIIIIGLYNLIGSNGIRISGIIMIIIGSLFLLETTGFSLFGLSAWDIIFPLMIILVGAWLLIPKSGGQASSKHFVKQVAIFSGAEVACDSEEFKGADVMALFGGIDLDLRGTRVGADKPAKIEVVAAFGGVDIVVPEGARVKVTGIPLFGGWSNRCNKASEPGEADYHINALVAFGGLEVKDKAKKNR